MAERSRVNSSTAAVMASGGSVGFNRSNPARSRVTNTKMRTLNPACPPPFSQWEKGSG